jgi:hypothetical protein
LLRRKAGDLREARIHSADPVVRVEKQNSFFDPFEHVLQFRVGAAALHHSLIRGRRSEHHRGQVFTSEKWGVQANTDAIHQLPFANLRNLDGLVPLARQSAARPFFDARLLPRAKKVCEAAANVPGRSLRGSLPSLHLRGLQRFLARTLFQQDLGAPVQIRDVASRIEKNRGLRAVLQKGVAAGRAPKEFRAKSPAFEGRDRQRGPQFEALERG